ncbi:MAG: TerC family protein [Bacteroidia bacterium]|nr:TerC family protein [Bacteroidia bacterium]
MDILISFLPLLVMEILLGIDNVIFISIVLSRLSKKESRKASRIWMLAGVGMRMVMLFVLMYLVGIEKELFRFDQWNYALSLKDIILFGGGMFLLVNSTLEIHNKLEGANEKGEQAGQSLKKGFASVMFQLLMIDFVFSIDGVITAIGMARHILPMFLAIAVSMAIMFIYAPKISVFIEKHPTFKILALSFLVLIAVLLIVEGVHIEKIHIPKGYIYFAMAFSFTVEMLNLKIRKKRNPVELRKDSPTGD